MNCEDSEEEINRQDPPHLIIQTHSGRFHSDDVVAIALLTNFYAKHGYQVSVLRSRDSEKFSSSNILVDVGETYDHGTLRFDHHQSSFCEKWKNSDIILSAAGIIWKHYGEKIVEMYLTSNSDIYDHGFNFTEETISDIVNIIYFSLIYDLDANDNGIEVPLKNNNINIPALVYSLNGDTSDEDIQDSNFNRAVSLVGEIFDVKFKEIINSYFNFTKDLEIVKQYDLTNQYLIISENIPTIFKCLNQLDPNCNIRFLIFCKEDEYTIKARRKNGDLFSPLCPIADEDYLRENLPNPEDIIFIHRGHFLAKTKTLKTAEELVIHSLWAYCENEVENNYKEIAKKSLLKNKHLMVAGVVFLGGCLYWKFSSKSD